MKKRIFICALIVALLFTNAALFSSAAGTELEQKYITVESYGTYYTQRVYTNKNGTIFVPITMLAQFGRLRYSEGASDYTFYRNSETSNSTGKRDFLAGARTITIAKAGTTATVSCYTSKNVAKTVSTVNFSKAHTVDKKLYLPLTEALPLLDAKVEITNDGVVHIYANSISAFYALYSGNMDLCAFDASEMVGGGFISASGLIVDSVLNFRFDRLDVMTNSGAIKDYSSLFKKLLTDNETYLSAFDKTETPLDKQISILNSEIGDLSDFAGGVKDLVKAYEYLFSSTKHSTYKEFSKEASTGLHSGVDLISAADKIISFADRYTKQVEDHRNMLNAVYGGSSKPAAVAANEVYTLYGQNTTAQITSAATSELRSYLSKIFSGAVSSTAGLTPYKIAFDAVQFFLPEMAETWSDAAELYFIANVVNDSYNVATGYENNPKFDEASLERQRLALIMMLISSKYGYETFYGEEHDSINAIDPWLEKLYLAADSVECVSSGYYSATKSELQKTCRYIVSQNNSSPDGNSSPDTLQIGDHIYFGSVSSENEPDIWQVINVCGDYALIYNMCMQVGEFDASVHAETTAISLMRYHTYGSATWEYSDLRNWLNSRDNEVVYEDVIFDYQSTGIATLPWDSNNSPTYLDSKGYLNAERFTDEEYYIIQPVTHKNLIPWPESGMDSVMDVEFGDFSNDLSQFYESPYGVSTTTDLMFPLNGLEFKEYVIDNELCGFNYPNGKTIAAFWLRDSVNTDFAGFYGYYGTHALTAGSGKASSNQADLTSAIRPACYIDTKYISDVSGVGDFESPYKLTIDSSVIERTIEPFVDPINNSNVVSSEGLLITEHDGYCSVDGIGSCTDSDIIIPAEYNGLPVTIIGDSAFLWCTKLTSVVIPNSIIRIGNCAFQSCTSLTGITVPDSVKDIGTAVFYNCENLKNVSLSNGITAIKELSFAYCVDLNNVVIPDSVINIGISAFAGCTNLSDIIFNGTIAEWKAVSKATGTYSWNKNVPAKTIVCSDGKVDASEGNSDFVVDASTVLSDNDAIIVPDVVGMEQIQAVYLLHDMGLQFQVWWNYGDDRGDVFWIVSQSIPAGTKVARGTLVRLQISNNKPNTN